MKLSIPIIQYEKHLSRRHRCPSCFCRYLLLTNYSDTNTWDAECKSCGLNLYEEQATRHAAIKEWKAFIDRYESSKLKSVFNT